MSMQPKSVLILGGSGNAGAGTAAVLRRRHPTLPLTIAGRDLGRAKRAADELGTATAAVIDVDREDLGLAPENDYLAVIAALWDRRLYGLRFAQRHALPYASISSGMVEIAPEVIAGAQRPDAAPVLVASHYMAGIVVLTVLQQAVRFDRVDTIRIGAVLDETDAGGPAGMADLERLSVATSAGFIRRDGVFTWISATEAEVGVCSIDGTVLPGRSVPILDVPSIALATGAPNVCFDLAVGESASRRRGDKASTEVRIDIAGVDRSGTPLSTSRYLVHPAGQGPLTALGLALGAERLLGLRGPAVVPGIHTPEGLLDPAYVVEQLHANGAVFFDA